MKKSVKQLLSSFLVIIMLVGVVPFAGLGITASAAETYSGTCGENLTWKLDTDTGELVISGTGEMWDYEYWYDGGSGHAPWNAYNNYKANTIIKSIVVEDGVTSIGNYAFIRCLNLEKVVIADTVVEFGWDTFTYSEKLIDITIGNNVTEIGASAFYDTGYYNDINNWKNGALYLDNYLLLCDEDKVSSGKVVIKDGTTIIAESAFANCSKITDVIMPDSVEYIGAGVFSHCYALESITLSKKLTKISDYAFENCNNLKNITIPESVTYVGEEAFDYCQKLESIKLSDGIRTICNYAFYGCESLADISIGKNIERIGHYSFHGTAFYNDESNWEEGVLYIGKYLIATNEVYKWDEWADWMEPPSGLIKEGTKVIADSAYDCATDNLLENITIPVSVTNIGTSAFQYCSGLTNVYFNGTETEWNDISIEEGNECLLNATIHFLGEEECDHSYTSKVTIEPTYTTEGERTYTCEKCGDTYTEIIPKLQDHAGAAVFYLNIVEETADEVKLEVYLDPRGCVVSNFDLGVFEQNDKISDCTELEINDKYFIIAGNNVTRLIAGAEADGVNAPHRLALYTFTKRVNENVDIDDFDVVVTNFGSYCCDKYEVNKNLPENTEPSEPEHNFNHIVVPSTCTVAGMEYDICSDCGEVINSKVLPLAPHSWSEWKIVREATAALEGIKERSCMVCGTTEEELIPKLNVIVDDESGILIEFNDEYDSGVEIKVDEIFDGNSFQILNLKYGNTQSVVFDITTEKDGVKVQPDGKVKVRIPLPAGFDTTKMFVCYVDSTNGTVTPIPATVVNGYVEFETDHFSYYAIVEKLVKVNSVSIDDISIGYKDSTTITPNINVDAGVDYTVTYSSSNTDVVSIDANGKLTTNDKGSATITVTVTDEYGNTVTDTCNVNVSYEWWQWIIVIVLFGWIWY